MANPSRCKRSKYRNQRCEFNGIPFDSKAERERYIQLKVLESAGEIAHLQYHCCVVTLTDVGLTYKPDFTYRENNIDIYEDVKGVETDRWKIIKKLWRGYGLSILRVAKPIYSKSGIRFKIQDIQGKEIIPDGDKQG